MSLPSNVEVSQSIADSLLEINNLLYKLPPETSISSKRNVVKQQFNQTNYTDKDTMVCQFQTGTVHVNAKNSYLRFIIKPNAAGDFASGSACNAFNRITVIHRAGKELCRLERANLCIKFKHRWENSDNWFNAQGYAMMYPNVALGAATINGNNGDGTSDFSGDGIVCCIPMSVIPCFNQDKLLPPQLLQGCRVEIELEKPAIAFKSTALGGVTSYSIINPEFHCDAYVLADQMQRKLMEESVTNGLNLVHKEWYHSQTNGAAQANFDFQVQKACSKGLKAMLVTRETAEINSTVDDSMASEDYNYLRFQNQVGNAYYPNAPLEVPSVVLGLNTEAYQNTLQNMGSYQCAANVNSYMSDSSETFKDSIISVNLNKSSVSSLQGTQINNNNALIYNVVYNDAATRTLDVFFEHARAMKLFASNVVVRD